jgi:arylsulfatase A
MLRITRRLAFALTLLVLCTQSALADDAPPNIVFIFIDDMGWTDPACYGNMFDETPQIDRLAAEGVRFTDFYSAGAVCSPTRASVQAGQYQARYGITDFIPGHWRPFEKLTVPEVAGQLPLEVVSPAELLKRAGYSSAYFGKWHLGGREFYPDRQGYDEMIVTGGRHFAPRFNTTPHVDVPDGTYLADFLTDRTLDFIETHRDGPFFVFLSHQAVHIPLEAKLETIAHYRNKPKPETGVNNPIYAAMVQHVDESLGRIVAKLDELGLTENTVVVFTSDNGGLHTKFTGGEEVSLNLPLRGEKGQLYEGGIRVPLIVKWPGVTPPGTVCAEPTISIDFWPTFAEIAGIGDFEHQQPIDGLSLVPLLRDPDATLDRDAIYFHYPHYHHSEPAGAIRQGDWKLIEFFADGRLELYNLADDISESNDLAATYPDRARAMQKRLASWRKSVNAAMPTPNPDYDPARAREFWNRRTGKPLPTE